MTRLASILLIVLYALPSSAQVDFNFLTLRGVPQSVYANPAQMPRYRMHIGLPVISSMHLGAYSNSLRWGDIVKVRNDGTPLIDLEGAVEALKDKNYVAIQGDIDILSFSFRQKSNYFSFSVRERFDFKFSYPKSFIQLLWQGNGSDLLGQRVYLDGLGIDFRHFREYAFGIAHDFDGKMILGARVKFLAGISDFSTDQSDLYFYTDPETYYTVIGGRYSANTAGFFDEDGGDVSYPLFRPGNRGLALDLGMRYQINNKWELAGSLVDYGMINWKNNAVRRYDDSVFFNFNGVQIRNMFNVSSEADSISQELINRIDTTFSFTNVPRDYQSILSSSISFGGIYHLNRMIELSAFYSHFVYRGNYQPSFIINSRFALKNWVELSANYSINGSAFLNVGAGVVFNLSFLQVYFVTNNLLSHFNPSEVRNANFRFGTNLIFGRKKFKR